MLYPQPRTINNSTRHMPRLLSLAVALISANACGAAFAQAPAKSAAGATKPAAPTAQVAPKSGAGKDARARRVVPTSPKPAPPAREGAAEAPASKGGAGSADKSKAEPESSPSEKAARRAAESSPAEEGSKAVVAGGAAGVESELNSLRMRIRDAAPEERARLQRELVDRLVALDRKADAAEELRLLIHEDRLDPVFFYNTGNALARLGDANAAADAYRKAVSQRRGNYSRALNNLGVVLTRQGRWDEAQEVLASALTQENFTYAEASYNLGRLHLLRAQTDLALREWSRTLRLQPGHAEATAALARVYAEEGDPGRALALLENFTARATRSGGAVPKEIAYARTAIVESRARVAEGGAGEAGETRPDGSRAPGAEAPVRPLGVDRLTYSALETARAASERGRHEEAVRHYRTVLSRSGGYFPPANLELGYALIALGRAEEAAALLRPVAERDGARYPAAHYHLARLRESAGQLAPAAEHFARAAALYGDANPQVLLDLSRVREKMGDARGALEAVEAYSVSIARQGSVPHWVVERADALRMKAKAVSSKQ